MSSRKLTDLAPDVYRAAEAATSELDKMDFPYVVSCTLRTAEEQAANYAVSRQPLPVVNALRERLKLPPLTAEGNKRPITWAPPGKSLHESGRALDIYPLESGKLAGDTSPLWETLVAVMERHGFEAGAKWKGKPDKPHFQIRKGA